MKQWNESTQHVHHDTHHVMRTPLAMDPTHFKPKLVYDNLGPGSDSTWIGPGSGLGVIRGIAAPHIFCVGGDGI